MKHLAAELITIVLGVLIALGVDGWRQDREELKVASEHLSDITEELRQNLRLVRKLHPDLSLRARRVELLGLARNEAAATTGRWYALARISGDLTAAVQELARWDRSTTPQLEYPPAPARP